MKRFWVCLVVALVVHIAILRIPLTVQTLQLNSFTPNDDWIYLDPNTKKPIIQTSRIPDYDSSAKARFGGEFRNRVPKETRSPITGKFHEGGGGLPSFPQRDGLKATLSSLMPFGASPNKFDAGVELGNQTLLNTDPILYASFLNRIADEIYDSWVQYARDAINDHIKSNRLEANVYVTKLQIVLDEYGNVQGIQTLKSSGIEELDEAPRRAFFEVKIFRNPPIQMFKQEKLVRFIYEFHFHWRTSLFNIVPWG